MNKTLLSGLIGLLMPLGGYASMAGRQYAAASVPQWQPASRLDLQTKTANRNLPADSSPELQQGQRIRELVIIDAAVPDKTTLYRSLKPGVDVVELNSEQDGVLQLQQVLQNYSGLQAVHLVSHAEQGKILLGNSSIDSTVLTEHPDLLRQLNQSVVAGGDLLLYGCDLAAGVEGQELLELVSSATQLDVAASSDKTGAAELGGDWDLEIQQGDIQSTLAFSSKALADYSGVLAPETYIDTNFCSSNCFNSSSDFTSTDTDIRFTGSANVYAYNFAGESFYLDNGETGPTGHLNFAANDDVLSFELTQIRFGTEDGASCPSAQVIGYTSSGTETDTFALSGPGPTTITLSNIAGKQLTRFRVSASGCSNVNKALRVVDFTVDNKTRVGTPVVTTSGGLSAFTEGTPVAIDTALTLSDSNSANMASATISITGNFQSGQDVLSFTDQNGISGNYNSGTGVLTLSGTSSLANYQAALRSVTYSNSSDEPNTASRTISFVVSDGSLSNFATTKTVSVTGVNDAPTLSATGGAPTYTENGSAADLFSGVTGSTVESGQNINQLVLTVTNLADGSNELLRVDGTDIALTNGTSGTSSGGNSVGYSVSVAGSTATVTLTGSWTTAATQTLVDNLSYRNTSENPTTASNRVVTLTSIRDNGGISSGGVDTSALSVAATVTLAAVNDAPSTPTDSNGTINTVVESAANGTTVGITASSTDPESSVSYSLMDNAGGRFAIDSSTGVVTVLDGGLLDYEAATSHNITVRATDGSLSADQTFSINVTDVDDTDPTVTSVTVPANDSYKAGEQLSFIVNFNEAVTLDTTGGTPRIAITIGSSTVYASYVSGSGSSALTFSYTVQSGDLDADGVALASAVDLNGGTIRDSVGNNANTTLNSVGSTAGVVVDAVAPAAPSAPDLTSGSDTGSSTSDDITGDETPTFTGTAEAGSTVTLYDTNGTTALGSATTNGSGNWTITSSVLTAGSHTVTAKAADAAGNVSVASAGLTITIDLSLAPLEVTTNSDSGDDATIGASLSADTADGGGLSLREALHYVANNGIITFYHCLDGQTIALSSAATVKSGVTLDTSAVDNLTISGGQLDLLGGMTLNHTVQRLTLNSDITGSGTLVKTGAGELTLGSANNSAGFSGDVTVSAGRLNIGSDSAFSSGTLTLDGGVLTNNSASFTLDNPIVLGSGGGGVFVSSAAQTLTLSGDISGSGTLSKTGGGVLTFSGTNSFSGGLSVSGTNGVSASDGSNLGAGSVTLNEATVLTLTGSSVTLNNAINFAGSATVSNSNAVTLSGVLSGSGSMTKAGAGVLSLSATNTATGSVTVSAGGLSLIGGSSIGNAAEVTVDAGATLTLAGGGETIGALAGAGNVVLNSYNLTTGGNNGSSTFSGVIAGTGSGITKAGTGTFTLTGNNTYTGSTSVSAGTLRLNRNGGAIADTSDVTVASGATIQFDQNETLGSLAGAGNVNLSTFTLTTGGSNTSTSLSGVVSGSGNLIKTGTGTFTLSGANSYTGTTAVTAGVLSVAGDSNLGAGTVSITDSGLTITAATTLDNAIVLTGTGTITNSAAATLSGVLSGTGTLTKSGAGTLQLAATNSYTGTTTVTAGSLLVSGDISASSSVSVASGATLGGTGSVSGVTIASGATLSPGSGGAGALTITNGLTIAAGGSLMVDVAGTVAGTQYDQLIVTGTVDITGASLSVNHSYTGSDGDSYTVIVNDSTDAISGTFSGVAEGAAVTATGNSSSLSVSYLGDTGNDMSLSFLAVPGAPTAVTATAGNASASVAFTAPAVTGSSAITGYTVTSTPGNLTATGTSSPIQITGLTNGTSYTFTVRATNSAGQGAASASSNAVTPAAPVTNTAPVISGSPATTVARGSSYSFTPSAFDADGQVLTFSISTLPGWASFSSSTGALTGTPAATDVGTTSGIVISVTDGTATASLPAFSITVEGSNVAPVAADGAATTAEDTAVSLSLTAQDEDQNQLSYEIVSAPAHGSVTLQGSTVVYTPERNYHGTDSLSFIAKDAELSSNTASINLTVTPVNDAPVAVDDSFTQERVTSEQYALAVLANDTDVDGDPLRIDGASTTVGSVSFSADSLSLTVPALYVGPVTLRYSVTDGKGGRGTATVGLLIEGGNAANLPVITVPADIVVNATGLSTRVALGTATAVDRNGNRLSVSLIRGEPLFEPGEHTVYWQATDASGNTATKAQKVSVRPLVSLSKDQVVTEGSDVSVDIILNGPSPVYPLQVPYSVSGSADGTDHTLISGVAEISSGVGTSISFTVLEDGQADPQEDIVISLSAVNQGSKNSTRIEVSDQNIAPVVALGVTQSGENRLTVAQNGGAVTISATLSDANTTDVLTGNWTLGGLTNASAEQTQLSFDPAEQGPGLYQVSYTVTDNGSPALSATSSVFVVVQASLPTLGAIDSDGDLIPDNEEGFADSDGDGIPDYQDAISECNVMPTELLGQTQFLAEGDPGVCLRLGTVAAQTNAGGLQIKQESIQVDPVAVYIGGIFDFIAYGLPEQGQSYSLAIPQRAPVPANAGYRKYSDATGWVAFVSNEKNSVSSSQGESGYCPPPGDASWTPGLTEGHWCVQVTVEDGGPNDADGVANGAIVDPGGVAVALSSNRLPVAVADTAKTQENTAVVVNVLANDTDADGDSLRISQAVANFGSVTILDNQTLSYMPTTDFKGVDKVVYSITDGKGGTASAELLVDVSGNTAPVAADDVASTDDKTAVLIAVLANDRDADGHSLTVSAASAQQGTVRIEADQRLRYTPKAGFDGVDIISYRVTDSQGGEASAQVRVTVTALKDVVVDNKSGGGSMTLWMVLALAGAVVLRRRSVVGLAAMVLLWFSPVSQAEQWYLQGSVGHSKADQQQSRLVEELPNGTITAFDDNDSSYGLALGYQLHPHVALELGYQDLGEAGSEISGESLTPAQYHDLVKAVSPVLVDGYTAAVRLSLWQNDLLNLEVPVGLFFWDSKIESRMGGTVLRSETDGNDWFLGVQLNYKLAQDWQLGLGYQQLNLEPNDVNSWQLSVRYSF